MPSQKTALTRRTEPRFFSRQVAEARRFYLALRPKPGRALTVVSGGWERCAADYRVRRDTFAYFGLEYVAGGLGRVELDGKVHPLRAGAVFAYGPGVPHEIQSESVTPLSKYFVNFVGRPGALALRSLRLAPGQFRHVASGDDVQKVFADLVRAGQGATDHASRLAALHLEILFLTLADAGSAPHRKAQRAFATYTRCRRHLEEHFLELATIEEAAAACHVDVSYFCRLFARFARRSPYTVLQRLRMNHAAALLENGQHLVREVAEVMEMDPFHFSRAFKRVHGVSPSTFGA